MSETEHPTGLLAGVLNRDQLQQELDCCKRTIIRYEQQGMPVLRIGKKRLYDIAKVREWILNGGMRPEPRRRRLVSRRAS